MSTADPRDTQAHVTEMIEAYLAGGLTPAERARVEGHVALCAACSAAVVQAEQADAVMRELFADVRPADDFEDRVVDRLRAAAAATAQANTPAPAGRRPGRFRRLAGPFLHPMVRLAVGGLAAAVVLGAIGLGASYGLQQNALPLMGNGPRVENGQWTWGVWGRGRGGSRANAAEVAIVVDRSASTSVADAKSPTGGRGRGITSPAELARTSLGRIAVAPLAQSNAGGKEGQVTEEGYLALTGGWGRASGRSPVRYGEVSGDVNGRGEREWDKRSGRGDSVASLSRDGRNVNPTIYSDLHNSYDFYKSEAREAKGKDGNADHVATDVKKLTESAPASGPQFGKPALPDGETPPAAVAGTGAALGYTGGTSAGAGTLTINGGTAGLPGVSTATAAPKGPVVVLSDGAGVANETDRTWNAKGFGEGIAAGQPGQGQGQSGSGQAGGNGQQANGQQASHFYSFGMMANGDQPARPADFSDAPNLNLQSQSSRGGLGGGNGGGGFGGGGGAGAFGNGTPGGGGRRGLGATRGYSFENEHADVKTGWTESDVAHGSADAAFKPAELMKQHQLGGSTPTAGSTLGVAVTDFGSQLRAGAAVQPDASKGDKKDPKDIADLYEGKAPANGKDGPATDGVAQGADREGRVKERSPEPGKKADDGAAPSADTPPAGTPASAGDPATTPPPPKPENLTPPPGSTDPTPAPQAGPEARPPVPAVPRPAPDVQPKPVDRKIIRNGDMTFEVDGFDSAARKIAEIAREERGFVSTTDSEKLPNGKMKGLIVVRCPPENLDTLVLKLRGLGDLKGQKIVAQDITKQYTDIASRLRAAQTMQERLQDIIKNGKGTVKDIVEAQKQLGEWTEKVEAMQGEINYYNGLVSLSTLAVTLQERDVRSPTEAAEVEKVQMSVEADDVEKARADAIKAIDAAKGRIVQAELKQHEAGQYSAVVVADVPPDASGPLVDRLRQLGKVAALDVDRKQETAGGTGPVIPGLKVERKDTRFQVSIYNLANVAPRQTTVLTLAAADVEKAYRAIRDQVTAAGGRIVESKLSRPSPDQVTGVLKFHVTGDKADVLSAAVRATGDVMRLDVAQSADVANTTEAKRGFVVDIQPLATVTPRESTTLSIATASVPESFNRLLDAAKAGGGRILTSQLNEQDANNPANVSGQLDFDVMRENWAAVDAALRQAGLVVSRSVGRSTDTANTVDSKVRLQVTLFDAAQLTPRETIQLTLATRTVPESFNKLLDLARDSGGRAVGSTLNQQEKSNVTGSATIDVPRESWPKVEAALKEIGTVAGRSVSRAQDGPRTVDTKTRLVVTVMDDRAMAARETVSMTVVTAGVSDRYKQVLEALRSVDAQVYKSDLNQKGGDNVTGELEFAVRRSDRQAVEHALFDKADVFNRNVQRASEQQPNTLDDKVRYVATLWDAERQPPRETYTVAVEVSDVTQAADRLLAEAVAARGRTVEDVRSKDGGKQGGRVVVDVPLSQVGSILGKVNTFGDVTVSRRSRNEAVPEGTLSRAQIEVTLGTPETIRTDKTLSGSVREGVNMSLWVLLHALTYVIIGLCVIVPLVLFVWVVRRLIRASRRTDRRSTGGTGPTAPPPAAPPPGAGPVPAPA